MCYISSCAGYTFFGRSINSSSSYRHQDDPLFWLFISKVDIIHPDGPELKDLLLLKQLIAYCNTAKDDQLPDHFMVTFKLIRMADFLGCDTFLENTAKQLGTSVLKINNSNSVKTVREYVRNAYRWASK